MPDGLPFHDPVYDGATDPTVIRHRESGEWWMFYTQRRASIEGPGVAWVHGSRIGIARSPDALIWTYAGTLPGLDAPPTPEGRNTHWAPEVIWDGTRYRMFLTVISGIPDRWEGHDRHIVEYTSDDLFSWSRVGVVPLGSDRVIDACAARCPDGLWRLWFKNEADASTTWCASTPDFETWMVEGQVIGGRPHEGPNVFALGGWWWLLVDEWRGMGVYRSADARTWERQGGPDAVILAAPGAGPEDATIGRHGDVVVHGERAVLYYFTHPWWNGSELGQGEGAHVRISAIHAAALTVSAGELLCDRDGECRHGVSVEAGIQS